MRVDSSGKNLTMRRWPKFTGHQLILAVGLVFGIVHSTRAMAAPSPNEISTAGTLYTQFAFADFDGDRQPDLAVLQVERSSSLKMHYSLTFSLSGGNRQFIGLVAPSGGLELVSRDVNGDNTLDLVVTAKWMHQTVAVFLNDGFGTFTSADPSGYLVESQQSGSAMISKVAPSERHAALLQKQPRSGELSESCLCSARNPAELPFVKNPRLSGSLPHPPFSGRAPPHFSKAS